jgi:methyl-accepting chemotaxis protein
MTEGDGNGQLDIFIDQVGRLAEGLTDIKESLRQLAATSERQAETTGRMARIVENLVGML